MTENVIECLTRGKNLIYAPNKESHRVNVIQDNVNGLYH